MFSELLAKRATENNPIRVGIIGAGKFGGGLITQITSMKGIKVCAVADINLDHVKQAYITNRISPEYDIDPKCCGLGKISLKIIYHK